MNKTEEKILLHLHNRQDYIMNVSMTLNVSYSHIFQVVKDLERRGLAKTNLNGRRRIVSLEEKGWEIAKRLKEIKEYEV